MKAVYMSPRITGRGYRNDCRRVFIAIITKIIFHNKGDIVAYGFTEACGSNAYQLRVILLDDIVHGQIEIGAPAENRSLFGEIGRCNIHRFVEMADQISAYISGATLGPVEQGHGSFDALENQRRAQRTA
jgi:hypothetical protein